MEVDKTSDIVRFGDFQADLKAGELLKGGTRIRVPLQSIQVLGMLVARPGQVVTRDELQKTLWPNDTIVEFDHSINAAINRLRQALGDVAESPRYIETLPKRGYRFLMGVERPQSVPATVLAVAPPSSPATVGESGDMLGDLVGRTIFQYRIVKKLGQGGGGVVYRAEDSKLLRPVALKFLTEDLSDNPRALERFRREAHTVSALNHSNICTIYDIGEFDGLPFLVMEYLEGETLEQRLKKGPLPFDQGLRYSVEIADALAYAHRHGVIHRDLKPGNIMLTKANATVLDFGLAKVGAGFKPAPAETLTLTEDGAILGTLQYMAPEQLEGKDADVRSDIFAFGAVVYEMAAGKKAFEGKGRASVIAAILEREPPPLTTLAPMSPAALDRVVKKCLAKDPDRRWQSAQDLKDELQWIAEGGSQAGVPAPVIPRRRNRERLAWAIAGIGIAAAIVLGLVAFRRPSPEERLTRFIVQAPEGAVLADDQATGGPAISPDGHHLAFVASHAKSGTTAQLLLWVRALDSLYAQPLTGTEGASFPFWSPDSGFIGFFAQGKLKKIDATGRSVQTICDAPRGYGASAWSQEGVILFSPAFNASLHRVPAAGGAPTPATVLDTSRKEISHLWVQFLPDGRHFLYTALVDTVLAGVHSEDSAIYVTSLDSGKGSKDRKRLHGTDYMGAYAPSAHGGTGHLLFWHNNSLMAQPFDPQKLELTGEPIPIAFQGGRHEIGVFSRPFSISKNGVLAYPNNLTPIEKHQMVWYDRAGKRLGTLGEPGNYGVVKLSPDQKQLVVDHYEGTGSNVAVWVFDLIRNTTSRLTFHPGVNGFPTWSPDGSRIAFTSNWEGSFNLYQKAASGVGSEELMLKARNAWPTDWSRDGHFIVYDDRSTAKATIWVLPLEGDRKPFPFEQYAWQAAFSPDGRWLAYASDESGKNEVYVRAFTGKPGAATSGGKWLISDTSGFLLDSGTGGLELTQNPRWRRDGKELFYVAPDGKLMAVETRSGANFEAGAPKLLFDTHSPYGVFDVTADGQRFLVVTPVEQAPVRSPITVVLNWQAGLKR